MAGVGEKGGGGVSDEVVSVEAGDKVVSPVEGGLDLRGAVAWVARNFDRVVSEGQGGRVILRWERALEPAPSDVARSYLRVAAQKPIEFFTRTVPKFLGEGEAEVTEGQLRDRKLVVQMRGLLAKLVETAPLQKQPQRGKASQARKEQQQRGRGRKRSEAVVEPGAAATAVDCA